jgi:hypothetical protein
LAPIGRRFSAAGREFPGRGGQNVCEKKSQPTKSGCRSASIAVAAGGSHLQKSPLRRVGRVNHRFGVDLPTLPRAAAILVSQPISYPDACSAATGGRSTLINVRRIKSSGICEVVPYPPRFSANRGQRKTPTAIISCPRYFGIELLHVHLYGRLVPPQPAAASVLGLHLYLERL